MERKSFRRLKSPEAHYHHHVYVVLLSAAARRDYQLRRENPTCDPEKPCVYVGMTGLDPEQRFQNHKQGIKASCLVQRYGMKLLPDLYEMYNPMPFEAAAQMEKDLAEDLRGQGFMVGGGS